ncbi:MAG: hypothetical protein ACHREM_10725, partial [Polyangiales bacterium]
MSRRARRSIGSRALRGGSIGALALAMAACGAPKPAAVVTQEEVKTIPGALMLAIPGSPTSMLVAGDDTTVVRGRVRWGISDEKAFRYRSVTHGIVSQALALPAWLSPSGVAASETVLLTSEGVALVEHGDALRPIARDVMVSPSVGAHEIWLRRGNVSGAWVRFDPATSTLEPALSPIAAPLLVPWSSQGTAGPEFVSPMVAYALTDLLGPIVTHDGGEHWSPLSDPAFVDRTPMHIAHVPYPAFQRDADRFLLTPRGLVPPDRLAPPRPTDIPVAATTAIESLAPTGVPLDDERAVLLADRDRFVLVDLPRFTRGPLDRPSIAPTVMVQRVDPIPDVSGCQIFPASPQERAADRTTRALAVCSRIESTAGSAGSRKVIG